MKIGITKITDAMHGNDGVDGASQQKRKNSLRTTVLARVEDQQLSQAAKGPEFLLVSSGRTQR
jgi:hypothetical protein